MRSRDVQSNHWERHHEIDLSRAIGICRIAFGMRNGLRTDPIQLVRRSIGDVAEFNSRGHDQRRSTDNDANGPLNGRRRTGTRCVLTLATLRRTQSRVCTVARNAR